MKKLFLIPLFSALFAFTGTVSAQAVDARSPDGLIKTVTQQVMSQIRNDRSIRAGNITRITQLVNQKILPYTDFRRTTQLTTGERSWRAATPAQQAQLVEQFKLLLIHTYSGALAQVHDQQIQYRPFRMNPGATDVVVRTTVMNHGSPVQLDYRLYKTPRGWRVYDLNVLGAWLIMTYRQQFQEKIRQSGINGLLQFLTQRNRQLASGRS